ncbi:hypothetical protein [Clostridium sp. AF21-20LB]|uniref:hypothetical protein n=1 Tax=Clostridium sp. AF21-20LB TaxID=2293003 RepID=UPI0015FD06D7
MDETKENEIKPDTADCQVQETAVQRRKRETLLREQTPDALWEAILAFEGAIFYTAKGLEYSYTIRGNEMFVSRKEKSVTRASILVAYKKSAGAWLRDRTKAAGSVWGKLSVSGVPELGIICASAG